MHLSALLALSLATIALTYPVSRDETLSYPVDVNGIVNTTETHGTYRDVITRGQNAYDLHTLNTRDIDGTEYQNIVARAKGTAWKNDDVPKGTMNHVHEYLQGMPLDGVQSTWAPGRYAPWHGDSKSRTVIKPKRGRSKANPPPAYQTKTILTNTVPPIYRTIVAPKGESSPIYVSYECTEWENPADIVKAMLATLS